MNSKKIIENEYELQRLVIKPFNPEEKETIRNARKSIGIDRPCFYHDAIVKFANEIKKKSGEKNADK